LAEEARKGELAPAKFLLEMSGLYPVSAVAAGEDEEVDADGEDGEDLAKVCCSDSSCPSNCQRMANWRLQTCR